MFKITQEWPLCFGGHVPTVQQELLVPAGQLSSVEGMTKCAAYFHGSWPTHGRTLRTKTELQNICWQGGWVNTKAQSNRKEGAARTPRSEETALRFLWQPQLTSRKHRLRATAVQKTTHVYNFGIYKQIILNFNIYLQDFFFLLGRGKRMLIQVNSREEKVYFRNNCQCVNGPSSSSSYFQVIKTYNQTCHTASHTCE